MKQQRKQEDILSELTTIGAGRGDKKAFGLLYRQWHPQLIRFAVRLSRNPEASVDIMQDSWIAIARGLSRLDDPAKFKSWATE